MLDAERPLHWVASLDELGGTVDQYIESLGLTPLDIGQRFARGRGPMEALAHLQELLDAEPELDEGMAFLTLDRPLSEAEIGELVSAVPPRARVMAFTSHFFAVDAPDLHVQGVPSSEPKEFALKVGAHISRLLRSQGPGAPINPVSRAFPDARREVSVDEDWVSPDGGREVVRVWDRGVPFDLFCDLRPGCQDLVVLGQSAVTRSSVTLPTFHRWSWLDDLDASGIALNDPTLYLDDALDGGWWFGTPERDYLSDVVRIIERVRDSLGLRNRDIVFYGGSLGGFSSLQMAACLPGARAVVDNPQTDMRRYSQRSAADAAALAAFGSSSITDVPDELLHRIDVVERFISVEHVPEFLYLQNTMDHSHVSAHCGELYRRLTELMTDRPWAREPNRLEFYSAFSFHRGGHFPLGRHETVATLKDFIARKNRRRSAFNLNRKQPS